MAVGKRPTVNTGIPKTENRKPDNADADALKSHPTCLSTAYHHTSHTHTHSRGSILPVSSLHNSAHTATARA